MAERSYVVEPEQTLSREERLQLVSAYRAFMESNGYVSSVGVYAGSYQVRFTLRERRVGFLPTSIISDQVVLQFMDDGAIRLGLLRISTVGQVEPLSDEQARTFKELTEKYIKDSANRVVILREAPTR
jgi:hypothetical protein